MNRFDMLVSRRPEEKNYIRYMAEAIVTCHESSETFASLRTATRIAKRIERWESGGPLAAGLASYLCGGTFAGHFNADPGEWNSEEHFRAVRDDALDFLERLADVETATVRVRRHWGEERIPTNCPEAQLMLRQSRLAGKID